MYQHTQLYRILWLSLACLAIQLNAQAQKGALEISISPPNAWIRVDTTVVSMADKKQPYRMTLSEGQHSIEAWFSGFLLQKDTIFIPSNGVYSYKKGLRKLDPAFKEYRNDNSRYLLKSGLRVGLGAVFLTASSIAWVSSFKKNSKIEENRHLAMFYKDQYELAISPEDIALSKSEFEKYRQLHIDEQEKTNRRRIIGISISSALTAASAWYIVHIIKNPLKKPHYESKNPFVYQPYFNYDPISGFGSAGIFYHF
jgi:hypothetical protein